MSTDGAHAVLQIDLSAIVANWRILCAHHPSGPVAAVVKADAYGLGAREIVPALAAAGCRTFFVAYVDEALVVRTAAPHAKIAVLSGLIPGTEALYLHNNLIPVLGSRSEITLWSACATRAQRRLDAMLHIDTGMARLGLSPQELVALTNDRTSLDALSITYILTHLVAAEEPDNPLNRLQAHRFTAARAAFPGVPTSFANSSGIFLGPDFASDLARPGAALYGVNPTPGRPNPMRSSVSLKARILAVREIAAGTGVGYNATWIAARPTRIATAALGYADGFHRALSNRAQAFFDGSPVPLVGRVSMDLITFDVTDHPAVQPGTWLEVLGPHQSPDQLALAAGTNGYEVLTSLGRRYHRIYQSA
jgi:alanine racemase